jgi:hypothetical protein
MSRTILNPEYANDLNGLFDGSGSTSVSASSFVVTGNGATSVPSISTNSSNNLVVSTASNSGLTISSPDGNTTIIPESGYLAVSANLQVPTLLISGNGSTSTPILSTTSSNNVVVSTASGTGLTLSNPSGAVNFIPQVGYLAVSGVLDASTFQVSGNGTTSKPTITTNSGNNLVVSTVNNSGITISTPQGNGTLSVNSSGQLTWNTVVIS